MPILRMRKQRTTRFIGESDLRKEVTDGTKGILDDVEDGWD